MTIYMIGAVLGVPGLGAGDATAYLEFPGNSAAA
jgi:hypothetical protein